MPGIGKPIQKGERRNPKGRPAAGTSIREQLNALMQRDLREDQLSKIWDDRAQPAKRRIAAGIIVRALQKPNIADFSDFLTGEKTIEEIRAGGVDTFYVKRAKATAKGDREIELKDVVSEEFDRIMQHTALTPAEEEKGRRLDNGLATERYAVEPVILERPVSAPLGDKD